MISVAMCTYNGSKYLKEQLESIIHQTKQPDEIVICDDQSKDNSVEIAKDVLKNWKGIVNIARNEKNLGFVKNFEKAIGLCHGDIIFLSDQDDVWDKRKIEIMMNAFQNHPDAVLVFHDVELVDKNLNQLFPSFWVDTLHFDYHKFLVSKYTILLAKNVVQGSASAIKREVYEAAKPFFKTAIHDEWLALVALELGDLLPIPQTLMKYRQADNQIGGMPANMKLKDKINRFLYGFPEKFNKDLSHLIHRESIFYELIKRYGSEQFKKRLDISDYLSFLEKRISCLKNGDIRCILLLKNYFRFYPNNRPFRSYCKDIVEILLNKIN